MLDVSNCHPPTVSAMGAKGESAKKVEHKEIVLVLAQSAVFHPTKWNGTGLVVSHGSQKKCLSRSSIPFQCKLACNHGNRLRRVLDRHGQVEVLGREIGTFFSVKATTTLTATTRWRGDKRSDFSPRFPTVPHEEGVATSTSTGTDGIISEYNRKEK